MPYIGNDLSTILKQGKKVYEYVATAGQTIFTGNDSNSVSLNITTDTFVNVFLNGIRLIVTDDYTVSTDTITLTSGASLNDELIIVADIEASVFNTYTRSETDSALSLKANTSDVYTQAQADSTFLTPTGDGSQLTGIDALPSQSGQAGNYLTTDGTNASWDTLDTDANSTTKALYEHSNVISANYSITSGNNAMSSGPITINDGISVTVPTGSVWTIV